MQDISCIIVTVIVSANTIHLSESTVVICLSKITWLAQNLYGSLFFQIGDFLCFAGTNLWVTHWFFLLWINFCYFKWAPDKSYFHVYWVREMDNTCFQAILWCAYPICKTIKPDYFSLSFDYNICGDWLFLWSIRSDLIISWCIVSPTKHNEFNLK